MYLRAKGDIERRVIAAENYVQWLTIWNITEISPKFGI